MVFQRVATSVLILAVLPVLVACTQTAAPADPVSAAAAVEDQEPVGSGVLAAIEDAQRTRARHRMTSTMLNHAAGLDPTGLAGFAIGAMEEEQDRIEEEKHQRVEEELQKALAEAEALQAQNEKLERRKASAAGTASRKKVTP